MAKNSLPIDVKNEVDNRLQGSVCVKVIIIVVTIAILLISFATRVGIYNDLFMPTCGFYYKVGFCIIFFLTPEMHIYL